MEVQFLSLLQKSTEWVENACGMHNSRHHGICSVQNNNCDLILENCQCMHIYQIRFMVSLLLVGTEEWNGKVSAS